MKLLAAILVALLLATAVTAGWTDKKVERKEELKHQASDSFQAAKEHLRQTKEDFRDSLHEKGLNYEEGEVEGRREARKGEPIHMPTLNEKLNEAAHDTGYVAGAAKEKVGQKLENLQDAAKEKLENAKETVKEAGATVREKFAKGAENLRENVKAATEDIKEGAQTASMKFKDRAGHVKAAEDAAATAEEGGFNLFDKIRGMAEKVRTELKGGEAYTKERLSETMSRNAAKQQLLAEQARLEYEELRLKAMKENAPKSLVEDMKRAKERLESLLHEKWSDAKLGAEKLSDAAKEKLHEMENKMKENAEYASNRASERIHTAQHRAQEHAEKDLDTMKEAGHCAEEKCAYDRTGMRVESEKTLEELEAAKEHHRHVTHAHADEEVRTKPIVVPASFNATDAFLRATAAIGRMLHALNPLNWRHHH